MDLQHFPLDRVSGHLAVCRMIPSLVLCFLGRIYDYQVFQVFLECLLFHQS